MALTGVWVNELGSVMVLMENSDGSVAGKYRSMVGRDSSVRHLCGRTSPIHAGQQMLAFTVCFEISRPGPDEGYFSVCAWAGWCGKNDAGQYVITANWLLAEGMSDQRSRWGATKVGTSIFHKVSDSADESLLTTA